MPRKAPAGSNSGDEILTVEAQKQLKGFFDRLETLADEASAIREAVKDVCADIKAAGFKAAPMKKLVALRAKDRSKLIEDKARLELYAVALGVEDLV